MNAGWPSKKNSRPVWSGCSINSSSRLRARGHRPDIHSRCRCSPLPCSSHSLHRRRRSHSWRRLTRLLSPQHSRPHRTHMRCAMHSTPHWQMQRLACSLPRLPGSRRHHTRTRRTRKVSPNSKGNQPRMSYNNYPLNWLLLYSRSVQLSQHQWQPKWGAQRTLLKTNET